VFAPEREERKEWGMLGAGRVARGAGDAGRTERARRIGAGIARQRWATAATAALLVGAASAASAHTGPHPIPPDSSYLIRWYQPHSEVPVNDWEIEVVPQRNPGGRFIASARVMADDSCWALDVPVAEQANVRMRSVVGSQRSSWSRWTAVPEPAGGAAAAAGAAGLVALGRRRSRQSS